MLTLIILDGYGLSEKYDGNAIAHAKKPNLDKIFAENPYCELQASGLSVGLPDGQMGNSEVGHMNMGGGRVVYQDLTLISNAINTGDFFKNKVFLDAVEHVKRTGGALHLIGLLSDGGVHSHNTHLYALLKLAKQEGLGKVYVHAICDGRDVPPKTVLTYIKELEDKMAEIGIGEIATVAGRYYTMDRDVHWDRVKLGYDAVAFAEGKNYKSAEDCIEASYENDITDEFIIPSVIGDYHGVIEDDAIINFNYRKDRARQITRSFIEDGFDGFKTLYFKPYYVAMAEYDATFSCPVAFYPTEFKNNITEYLSHLGKRIFKIAETEKYAHVTFYFNGGVEEPYDGEERFLIPSEKVATFDLSPNMRAIDIKNKAIELISSGKYDFGVLNFANCDMVGHTGNFDATIKTVETVDAAVGEIIEACKITGDVCIITADHGNADIEIFDDGKPCTSHTTNPVPFCIVGKQVEIKKKMGKLADIAPTCLKLMGLEIPPEMRGESLI
ncbi:2,3-bisphosphoglycerate-independent phosphoglycerate mutase [Treponema sp. R6D11]